MNPDQLAILRHSLGLKEDGSGREYRSHFVTGEGSSDYPQCVALVEAGLMTFRPGSELTGGGGLFLVTESGRKAARKEQP